MRCFILVLLAGLVSSGAAQAQDDFGFRSRSLRHMEELDRQNQQRELRRQSEMLERIAHQQRQESFERRQGELDREFQQRERDRQDRQWEWRQRLDRQTPDRAWQQRIESAPPQINITVQAPAVAPMTWAEKADVLIFIRGELEAGRQQFEGLHPQIQRDIRDWDRASARAAEAKEPAWMKDCEIAVDHYEKEIAAGRVNLWTETPRVRVAVMDARETAAVARASEQAAAADLAKRSAALAAQQQAQAPEHENVFHNNPRVQKARELRKWTLSRKK